MPAAKVQFLPEDRAWIAERIQEVLATGQLTLRKYGAEVEEKFAQLCGRRHAIAVNSGTASLEIILRRLDVRGKDILVPTNTFFATVAAVIHAGARPIFVDMDPASFGIGPEDVLTRLTPKTVGMIRSRSITNPYLHAMSQEHCRFPRTIARHISVSRFFPECNARRSIRP